MDEDFLNEDCQLKDVDELEDLDIEEEEALLEINEEDLEEENTLQNEEIEFVDEEGNPVEMGDGDIELYEVEEYSTQEYSNTAGDSQPDDDVLEVEVDGELDFSQENTEGSFDVEEIKKPAVKSLDVESTKSFASVKLPPTVTKETKDNSHKTKEPVQLETVQSTKLDNDGKQKTKTDVIDEESEEENLDDDHRERFKSERISVVNISSAKKRPDIPDSLDAVIPAEEAAKVNEFLAREQERKNRFRKPRGRNIGRGMQYQGKRPLVTPIRGEIPVQPVHPTPQQTCVLSAVKSVSQKNYTPHTPPRKILINPHFRGIRPSSITEEQPYLPERQSPLIRNSHQPHSFNEQNLSSRTQQPLHPPPMQNMGPRLPVPQQGQYRTLMDVRFQSYHGGERQLSHNQEMHFDQRIRPLSDLYRSSIREISPGGCMPQNDSLLGPPPPPMSNRVCDTNIHRFQPPISNSWNMQTTQANMCQQPMPLVPAPPRPMFEVPFRAPLHQPPMSNSTFRDTSVPPPIPQMMQMPPNFQHQPPTGNPPVSFPNTRIPPPNHQPRFPPAQMPMQPNMHLPQQQFRNQDYIPSLLPQSQSLPQMSYPNNAHKDSPSSQQNRNMLHQSNQIPYGVQNQMQSPQVQLSSPQRRYKAQMKRKRLNAENKVMSLVKQPRIENRKQWKDEETKDLRRKIEEQKKLREQILRRKEERRRMMATERLKQVQQRKLQQQQEQHQQLQQQQQPLPQQQQQQKPQQYFQQQQKQKNAIDNNMVKDAEGQNRVTVKQRIGTFNAGKQIQNPALNRRIKKVLVLRKKPQQFILSSKQNTVTLNPKSVSFMQQKGQYVAKAQQISKIDSRQQTAQKRIVAPPGTKINQIPSIVPKKPINQTGRDQRTVIPRGESVPQAQHQTFQVESNTITPSNRKVLNPNFNRTTLKVQRVIDMIGDEGKGDTVTTQQQRTVISQKTQTVLVENLTASTSEVQLIKLCSSVGPVEGIQLQRKERKALIKFKDPIHASNFQKKYQRHMLDLSMIQVSLFPA